MPVERAGIPFLPLDVQVPEDAREGQRIGEGVHDRLAVHLGDDRLDLGKHAQQRPRQAPRSTRTARAELVSLVMSPLMVMSRVGARPVVGGQLGPLAAVDAPTVADLDADRVRVGLLGVEGPLDEVERLIDRSIGVDHEMRRQSAALPLGRGRLCIDLKQERELTQPSKCRTSWETCSSAPRGVPCSTPLRDAVALGLAVAAAAALVDAAGLIGVESLRLAPQDDRAARPRTVDPTR